MNRTREYEEFVEWAKGAPLSMLVDAITGNHRYPSVVRDELRARIKPTPGLTISDLLWDQFVKAKSAQEARSENRRKLMEQNVANDAPGAFLSQLRENKDFWRWAKMSEDRGLISKFVFANGAEAMWKKCFDPRLTDSAKDALTGGELGLIATFAHALRDYKIEKEHDFHAFLTGGDE